MSKNRYFLKMKANRTGYGRDMKWLGRQVGRSECHKKTRNAEFGDMWKSVVGTCHNGLLKKWMFNSLFESYRNVSSTSCLRVKTSTNCILNLS